MRVYVFSQPERKSYTRSSFRDPNKTLKIFHFMHIFEGFSQQKQPFVNKHIVCTRSTNASTSFIIDINHYCSINSIYDIQANSALRLICGRFDAEWVMYMERMLLSLSLH